MKPVANRLTDENLNEMIDDMKTTFVMAIRCFRPDKTFETIQYEIEAVDLKAAMQEGLNRVFKAITFTPSSIEMKPQRHYVKNSGNAVNDDPDYNPAYFKLRSCTAKKAYALEAQAQGAADSLNRNRKATALPEVVYPCKFCKLFHVGTQFKAAA